MEIWSKSLHPTPKKLFLNLLYHISIKQKDNVLLNSQKFFFSVSTTVYSGELLFKLNLDFTILTQ